MEIWLEVWPYEFIHLVWSKSSSSLQDISIKIKLIWPIIKTNLLIFNSLPLELIQGYFTASPLIYLDKLYFIYINILHTLKTKNNHKKILEDIASRK